MESKIIREKFLNYFKERGHLIVPSSPLVLQDDPSVLFTTAGMQQFKKYYTQELSPFKDPHPGLGKPLGNKNIATCQKCFRTSDIEEVGDKRHLTFFEMLGNFSFGGYFKKEAINFAIDFIFNVLNIEKERVYFTYFAKDSGKEIPKDEESYQILKSLDISDEFIKEGTKEDNFWGPTGLEGPCGPTVEIYIDNLEVWNLVFNEYYCNLKGEYFPLKQKGVDTGAGLERLALVLQYPYAYDSSKTVFDTDLFLPLISYLNQYLKDNEEEIRAKRIIVDHLKSIVFLTAEGVVPSNIERGYVLRRLIRRVVRLLKKFHLEKETKDIIQNLVYKVIDLYQKIYPEIKKENLIKEVIFLEIDKFNKTLEKGLKIWHKLVQKKNEENKKIISGEEAFNLYQSYGFPLELIKEMAKESNLLVEEEGFQKEFIKHQEISRKGQEKKFGGHGVKEILTEEDKRKVKLHTATHLILAALKKLIDPNIQQKGSDINVSRLRFDFSFNRKLNDEELKKLEELVNQKIQEGLEVEFYETTYEEAIKNGAWGSFKERYPERVKVYLIKEKNGQIFSQEICNGPHVLNTKEIGGLKIIEHESIASNVKRIKAVLKEDF